MHPDKVKSEAKKEDEKFADYNCNKCRNCCKIYKGSISEEDIEKDESGMGYHTKHNPCDFLQGDGSCKLGECKPDSCKNILIQISQGGCGVC